jgi:hypothetical protein
MKLVGCINFQKVPTVSESTKKNYQKVPTKFINNNYQFVFLIREYYNNFKKKINKLKNEAY